MVQSGRKSVNAWSSLSYEVPKPYLRPRIIPKGETSEKRHFVIGPGDGPQFQFSKEKKGQTHEMLPYGKDAKVPPVSYLPLPIWAKPKESSKKSPAKDEKLGISGRGSFIDEIVFLGKKYNLPGPSRYFSEEKKEGEGKEAKFKDKKNEERPNFLMDYQYLGMNIPGPGTYKLKDTWEEIVNKKKQASEDKKKTSSSQAWKIKNDKGNGPGQYEIVRLMTIDDGKGEGSKQMKKFKSIPVFERSLFGVINKVKVYIKLGPFY